VITITTCRLAGFAGRRTTDVTDAGTWDRTAEAGRLGSNPPSCTPFVSTTATAAARTSFGSTIIEGLNITLSYT
jgi:hypothetical protein